MKKHKKNLKANVLSMRISDNEKTIIEEMVRHSQKSISTLMREAMYLHSSYEAVATNNSQ